MSQNLAYNGFSSEADPKRLEKEMATFVTFDKDQYIMDLENRIKGSESDIYGRNEYTDSLLRDIQKLRDELIEKDKEVKTLQIKIEQMEMNNYQDKTNLRISFNKFVESSDSYYQELEYLRNLLQN